MKSGALPGPGFQTNPYKSHHCQHSRDLIHLRLMEPVLFEIRCNLGPEDPGWTNIASLSLEVGYRGLQGKIIWKHIGWLREDPPTPGKNFAHALWKPNMTQHVLVLDFLPVPGKPEGKCLEQGYWLRKKIVKIEGYSQTLKTGILRGNYSDEHFTLLAVYPTHILNNQTP